MTAASAKDVDPSAKDVDSSAFATFSSARSTRSILPTLRPVGVPDPRCCTGHRGSERQEVAILTQCFAKPVNHSVHWGGLKRPLVTLDCSYGREGCGRPLAPVEHNAARGEGYGSRDRACACLVPDQGASRDAEPLGHLRLCPLSLEPQSAQLAGVHGARSLPRWRTP
jgi:hypothetical protein